MVASSVVSTILILNYHHRNADTHEMSEWVSFVNATTAKTTTTTTTTSTSTSNIHSFNQSVNQSISHMKVLRDAYLKKYNIYKHRQY